MRVALERLDGVESVTVSLEDGVAVIHLADENEVRVPLVRQVVRDNGFSPKQTDLRGIFETVALADGEIGVEIGDVVYGLRFPPAADDAEEHEALRAGVRVVLSGVIPERQDGGALLIEVQEILTL